MEDLPLACSVYRERSRTLVSFHLAWRTGGNADAAQGGFRRVSRFRCRRSSPHRECRLAPCRLVHAAHAPVALSALEPHAAPNHLDPRNALHRHSIDPRWYNRGIQCSAVGPLPGRLRAIAPVSRSCCTRTSSAHGDAHGQSHHQSEGRQLHDSECVPTTTDPGSNNTVRH